MEFDNETLRIAVKPIISEFVQFKYVNTSRDICYMSKNNIIVFDVDGTLAESSLEIMDENAIILNQLREKYEIAVCGGGTLDKILK